MIALPASADPLPSTGDTIPPHTAAPGCDPDANWKSRAPGCSMTGKRHTHPLLRLQGRSFHARLLPHVRALLKTPVDKPVLLKQRIGHVDQYSVGIARHFLLQRASHWHYLRVINITLLAHARLARVPP